MHTKYKTISRQMFITGRKLLKMVERSIMAEYSTCSRTLAQTKGAIAISKTKEVEKNTSRTTEYFEKRSQ